MHNLKIFYHERKYFNMANIFKKIKHAVHPQTKDIENTVAQTIAQNVKDLQLAAETLSKKARETKQLIKKDMKISEENAKKIAKELFQDSTKNAFKYYLQITQIFQNITHLISMEETVNKFKLAQEKLEKTQKAAKTEKPSISLEALDLAEPTAQLKFTKYIEKFRKQLDSNPIVSSKDFKAFAEAYNDFYKDIDGFVQIPYLKPIIDPNKNPFDSFDNNLKKPLEFFNNNILIQKNSEIINNIASILSKLKSCKIIISRAISGSKYVYFKSDFNEEEKQLRNDIATKIEPENSDIKDETKPIRYNNKHDETVKSYIKNEFSNTITIAYE